MSGAVFFVILVQWIAPILLVTTAILVVRRRRLQPDPVTHPRLAHLDRSSLTARWGGLFAGTIVAMIVSPTGRFGLGLILAPSAGALVSLVVLALNEAFVWRSARTPGVAALEDRSQSHYVPTALSRTLAVLGLALTALLLWCWRHQDPNPDELGTVGRSFGWESPVEPTPGLPPVTSIHSAGPFPGTWYSGPLAALLALCMVALAIGLALAISRPRNGSDPAVVAIDDQTRRLTIEAMVASALIAVGAPLASCSALTALAIDDNLPRLALVLGAVALFSIAACAWALAVLIAPGLRTKTVS
ncbi:hypothetical protein AAEX63_08210 [Luteococcus sp. H138]|uniref:hypothetical protein n=1 Tax=unclassified Luteococcus TaxID=2639923 RepID=UPI00313EF20E